MSVIPKYGWAYDDSDESWSDAEGETFEEAARYALGEAGADVEVVYVCECQPVSGRLALIDALDADDIIWRAEEGRENRPEDSAVWYDDALFDASLKAKARLNELLHAAAETWLSEFPGAAANIWEASNPREVRRADYTLTD